MRCDAPAADSAVMRMSHASRQGNPVWRAHSDQVKVRSSGGRWFWEVQGACRAVMSSSRKVLGASLSNNMVIKCVARDRTPGEQAPTDAPATGRTTLHEPCSPPESLTSRNRLVTASCTAACGGGRVAAQNKRQHGQQWSGPVRLSS